MKNGKRENAVLGRGRRPGGRASLVRSDFRSERTDKGVSKAALRRIQSAQRCDVKRPARCSRLQVRPIRQSDFEMPKKNPRRDPNCGAPTPTPVPSRISYTWSKAFTTSSLSVTSPARPSWNW